MSDSEFEVEKIVGKRFVKGHAEFLVKWKGWSSLAVCVLAYMTPFLPFRTHGSLLRTLLMSVSSLYYIMICDCFQQCPQRLKEFEARCRSEKAVSSIPAKRKTSKSPVNAHSPSSSSSSPPPPTRSPSSSPRQSASSGSAQPPPPPPILQEDIATLCLRMHEGVLSGYLTLSVAPCSVPAHRLAQSQRPCGRVGPC